MYLNLAPGAVGIGGLNLEQQIALASETGFEGIDLPVGDAQVAADPAAAKAKAEAAGLPFGGFGLPVDFRGDEAGLDALPRHAANAQAAGCTRCYTWIMPRHDELDYRANFTQHRDRLKPAAACLAEHGIGLGLEFVGPKTLRDGAKHTFIHTIDQMLELCDAIGTPNMGLLLDCFHWYTSGATREDITTKLRGRIVYVHVNDARAGRGPDEQIDSERALPCETGVIDIKAFLGGLSDVGYDGPLTAEPFMPELRDLSPADCAQRVMTTMRTMMAG